MIEAVLFDKDGTLIDFHGTWDAAVARGLREAAPDDASLAAAADVLAFDLESDTISAHSPLIAESNDVIFALVEPILDVERLFRVAFEATMETVAAAQGLPDGLHALRDRKVRLAIATNDYEAVVDTQLAALGWAELFDERVGSDSGFGAKPEPGMIHGVLDRLAVDPSRAIMVGDTGHDIEAGSRAGVTTVLVTNGSAPSGDVALMADLVVTHLGELIPTLLRGGYLTG